MGKIKSLLKDWTLFEKVWLCVFTMTILGLSYYWKDSLIGVTASLTGIWCVILVAKGKISNYYFGIVNAIAYAYVAYGWLYYGEVMLNLIYFLPMQFVGWYLWKKNKTDDTKNEVVIKFLTNKNRIAWALITIAATYGYGLFLRKLGGSMPFVDATSTVFSVIAMMLMAFRYMEQWVLWIIVDVVTITMWFAVMLKGGNDVSVLVMWVAFLVNAIYGMYNWIKLHKIQKQKEETILYATATSLDEI